MGIDDIYLINNSFYMKKIVLLARKSVIFASLALIMFGSVQMVEAQNEWSQSAACPGWNNPNSFTSAGSGNFKYQGRKGTSKEETPSVLTGKIGITWTGSYIAASSMASTYQYAATDYNCYGKAPNNSVNKFFTILSSTDSVSGPVNTDPNTGNNLPFVPTQFNNFDSTGLTVNTQLTKSIRIGDICSGGYAAGLYYSMYVTPDNAMLYLYYACVIEAPGHGVSQDPSFIIRVMQENDDGSWDQVSDTLAYVVTSTPKSQGGTVVIGKDGWHSEGSGYSQVYYKDWVKVSLNLSNLLYQNVRIEVCIRDCSPAGHYAYAYLCGECREMRINSSGCPPGLSTDVTTLIAPRGLDNYVWSVSEFGQSAEVTDLGPGGENAHFTFRQLTDSIGKEADGAYIYKVQAKDFHITKKGPAGAVVNIDSTGNWQTFRCTMTSALDPAKPFESHLYVNVQNTKPTMEIDTLSLCGGEVRLENLSYVPGDPSMADINHTKWTFYNNPNCLGVSDSTVEGRKAKVYYTDGAMKGVRVRTDAILSSGEECYSEAIYPIRPLPNPQAAMTVSKNVLCDDETTTLVDATAGSVERSWMFRGEGEEAPMDLTDTVRKSGDDKTLTRGFTHSVEPIEMTVRNGLFYMDTLTKTDTVWCENTTRDTVRVFLHPELEVTGDTIVCNGTLTDATVKAVGVEGCTYEWSTTLGSITGGLPAGNHLAVTPYAEKSTYYVKVTSPQGCVAWDSIHCYLIVPKLTMYPPDGRVCPGDVVTLTGSDAMSYTWKSEPPDPTLEGQDTMATVKVKPQENTKYTLIGHGGSGDNRCDATPLTATVTIYPYPVPKVSVEPGIVDTEHPTVTLRDESRYSASSEWAFAGNETAEGREVTHEFVEAMGVDSVSVTLTTANELGCKVVYPFGIPVNMFTAWLPNIFTPGSEDENGTFRLYTINDYDHFHIYVYNRMGGLVFESGDPAFEWDGKADGKPLPQGTYIYVMRFRKPGTYTVSQIQGTVSLVR